MKGVIYLSLTVGSVIGGYLGSLLDHGNLLGVWGIIGGLIGSFVGIWAGYKISTN